MARSLAEILDEFSKDQDLDLIDIAGPSGRRETPPSPMASKSQAQKRRSIADIYNEVVQEDALPESKYGLAGDIGSGLAGGILDVAEMPYRIIRTLDAPGDGDDAVYKWATKKIEDIKAVESMYPRVFKPSKETQESVVRRAVYGGFRALGPSAWAGSIGMLAGGLVGVGGVTAGAFGVSQFDRYMEDALKQGKSYDETLPYALASGLVEGTFEGAANVIGAKLLGFTGEAADPLKTTVKNMLTRNLGGTVKKITTDMPVEVGTEMIQEGGRVLLDFFKKH